MTKKEKRNVLVQKVCDFFGRHEILIVPTVYLIVVGIVLGIRFASRRIANMMGSPDAEARIAIVILVVIIFAGTMCSRRLGRKGHKLEGEVKGSNTSDKTE